MCSIIGYLGDREAAPVLVKGLRRMEYRGYDSVGVATRSGDGIEVRKGTGKVEEVNSEIRMDGLPGRTGIGHTRWATHGRVTEANAHPHPSSSGRIAIVHNGIIENFEEIRERLRGRGHSFRSETDSEVIANLLQENHEAAGGDVREAVIRTVSELRGHYAFVAMFGDGRLAAARFHEPLIMGVGGDGGVFLSSDVLGFVEYTDEAVYMENGTFAVLDRDGFEIAGFDGRRVAYKTTKVSKEFGDAYKGDYAHFTLKEIHEQPETIPRAGERTAEGMREAADRIGRAGNVYITGSGSSYNAALVAKQVLARLARVRSEAIMSSELQFSPYSIEKGSVLVAVSQSGESADVLDAVRIAKEADCAVIAVVNVMTSTLAREADVVIGMNCGPEIGVAATKSFTAQLAVLYKTVWQMSSGNGDEAGVGKVDFGEAAAAIREILESHDDIRRIAEKLGDVSDIYVLGRGIHHPIAVESALKLKELTYIHAEGIPGGELKHGPLALMDENAYVVIINPGDATHADTLTSAREIRARGAKIIGISDIKSDVYDHWIRIPRVEEHALFPILEIVPVQLLAYYAALEKDADPDYPRNLAKSVTVK